MEEPKVPLFKRPEPAQEHPTKKLMRKVRENPLVIPTVGLVVYGMKKMFTALIDRDKQSFQMAQRFKIGYCF